MSRIAGYFSRAASEDAAAKLSILSAATPIGPGGRRRTAAAGRAALAWCGRHGGSIAEDGDMIAVVDGLFYNPEELDAAAPASAGAGDARRLIALTRRFGFPGALARVNGDFAVALYSRTDDVLWLGRDRFGLKPLQWTECGGDVAFASQPSPLLALPGVSREVNRRWVAVFAGGHYRYIDNRPEETPYAALRQLPAASWLRADAGGVTTGVYWALTEAPDFEDSEAVLAERYRELLLDAVARRTRQASRAAFTLSGGMDSSSVLSCAAVAAGTGQYAYSSVYSDPTYDERDEIRSMLGERVAQWSPVPVDDIDVFGEVRRMVADHGEPVATATWLSHYLLCRRVAADGFDSLFGGMGGDELNAGEYEYFTFFFADLRQAGLNDKLEREIACWAEHHDHPIYRKNRATAEANMARQTDPTVPGRILPDLNRMTRYHGAVRRDWWDLDAFVPVMDHPFSSWLRNRTYQDIFRETAPCCLRAEDRNATAAGLMRIDPFYDHRLAEFMFRAPARGQIKDGVTKARLREAMRGVLPEETRSRVKKTGWNAPAHLWFSTGENAEKLADMIAGRAFRERGVYDVAAAERLLADHKQAVNADTPQENHMMFFWQLVNLETWFNLSAS